MKIRLLQFFSILVISIAAFMACNTRSGYKTINPDTAMEMAGKENLTIIDVRTPEEFAEGHLPGAVLIDIMGPDFTSEINKLDKNMEYLVYCKSGSRSAKAVEIMQQNGFLNIYNMDGGFDAWRGNVEK